MNEKRKGADKPPNDRAALDAALALLPNDYTDADYVVKGMREHFGDEFTAYDEARVRELVKPKPARANAGEVVQVLDWSRDPHAPVQCTATVQSVEDDGTINVMVNPPDGIAPYVQTGLREIEGALLPGQFKRVAAPSTDAVVKPVKGSPPDPVPTPGSPSH